TLPDGSHTITVKGTDTATNTATGTTTFVVDATAPVVTINTQPAANTKINTPTVTFTVTGTLNTPQCKVDAGGNVPCVSPFTASTVADGAHTITVSATDAAGNTGTATTTSFTVDTVAPTVAITAGPDNGFPITDTTPTYTFTATGATGTTCKVDAGAATSCTSPFTSAALAAGAHTVVITATDAAGNTATDTATFDLDPTVLCLNGTADRGDATLTSLLGGLSTATVEFWFRGAAAATAYELVDFDVPTQYPASMGDSSVRISYSATNDVVVTVTAPTGVDNVRTFNRGAGLVTDWHHYAVVFGVTTTRLFVDGTEVTGVQTTGAQDKGFDDAFSTITAATLMHVGVNGDTTSTGFAAGAFLDLRVSSTARYAAAFTPTYPQTTPPSTLLLYPADEGTGTSSLDVLNPPLHIVTWSTSTWNACP
ncbi:MAG: Ig-like domain-containing protein, partial [Proteobacteria bacterium]|nr:Ig-like domain-containing protein [Pseudomonadota bacterium]